MRLIRIIAFPFSLLYMLVVYVRNWCYDIGLFRSKSYNTPLICVGNLSVGGTGKTPMVEYLISILKQHYKVAILSRGYRRKSKGFLLANAESTVEQLGDEPFQIHRKFPEVSVVVDGNRQFGITELERNIAPDVILLDDAYQHRKVTAGLYILLTAYDGLYVDDWYLPTGNLRDGKKEAVRADIIVVTKCPTNLSEVEQEKMRKKLSPKNHQIVLFSYLRYDDNIIGDGKEKALEFLKGHTFTLVTGIANPKPLTDHLESIGLSFTHLRYKDHHFFTQKELDMLNAKSMILTTEKDFVRLKGKVENLYFLGIRHEFLSNQKEIINGRLTDFMKQNP